MRMGMSEKEWDWECNFFWQEDWEWECNIYEIEELMPKWFLLYLHIFYDK